MTIVAVYIGNLILFTHDVEVMLETKEISVRAVQNEGYGPTSLLFRNEHCLWTGECMVTLEAVCNTYAQEFWLSRCKNCVHSSRLQCQVGQR